MTMNTDWRRDPLVRIEKRLYPLQARLLQAARGVADDDLAGDLRRVAEAMSDAQARYFDVYDVDLSPETMILVERLAFRLTAAADRITDGKWDGYGVDAICRIQEEVLDALRADFIGTVLKRQADANSLSNSAAHEVAEISRKIFFISINASVEAARVGDVGRGFAEIGAQIRILSRETEAALERLRKGAPDRQ